jgi:glutathione synthase/RimK-type ligase-like ATP-grasp enzyme
MVMLWGISTDQPLQLVTAALQQRKIPFVLVDQQQVLRNKIHLRFSSEVTGKITTPEWSVDVAAIKSVYLRPYDTRDVGRLAVDRGREQELERTCEFENTLLGWIEMSSALIVNRPSAMAANNSKPYQLQLIRSAGFSVPDTLVTTDPEAVREFRRLHGAVIYKSVSGIRSVVRRLGVEHEPRLEDIAHCPTQFQQYIDGVDFRVHVVGDEIFACAISSTADDYRYPQRQDTQPEVQPFEVPQDIRDVCLRLAASMNLPVAGIDLRRTDSGAWYCFEVNPSPGFSFYEEAAQQPISQAIAGLLARNQS